MEYSVFTPIKRLCSRFIYLFLNKYVPVNLIGFSAYSSPLTPPAAAELRLCVEEGLWRRGGPPQIVTKGFPPEEKFVWTVHDAVMITMTIGISAMQLPQTIKPLRGVLGILCAPLHRSMAIDYRPTGRNFPRILGEAGTITCPRPGTQPSSLKGD